MHQINNLTPTGRWFITDTNKMTYAEFIYNLNGYKCVTTFWDDFSIADMFGAEAVEGTFERAFNEWKTNVVYLTELSLVLNHKGCCYYGNNDELSKLYYELWSKLDNYCYEELNEDEVQYYFRITD